MITSKTNPKIIHIKKLHEKKYRDQFNEFLLEDHHLILEAKKFNLIVEIFTTNKNINGTLISNDLLKYISTTSTPQEVIAIAKKKLSNDNLGNRILLLNNLQDPGNVGTLIRSACAFNWNSVIVEGVDIYSPKVIRATKGSFFKINVIQTNILLFLKQKNFYKKIGTLLNEDSCNYKDVSFQNEDFIALILGNESYGISKDIEKFLDMKIKIPISFESLNVAVAGGILLNEYQIK